MAEENNNITQDKKIDKLQFQMESVLKALDKVDENQKETNSRLEAMQKGFVSREEHKEFQTFVGTLATQKDLNATKEDIKDLQETRKWLLRAIGTVLIGMAIAATFVIK